MLQLMLSFLLASHSRAIIPISELSLEDFCDGVTWDNVIASEKLVSGSAAAEFSPNARGEGGASSCEVSLGLVADGPSFLLGHVGTEKPAKSEQRSSLAERSGLPI